MLPPTPTVTVAAVALGITKSHTGNFTQGQQGEDVHGEGIKWGQRRRDPAEWSR